MRVYTILDRAAEKCGDLMTAESDAVAARGYKRAMAQVPPWEREEYELLYMAEYDEKLGLLRPLETPEKVFVNLDIGVTQNAKS